MSLPPFKSLLALESVIRHGSVSAAAEELGVTQPAISQQLRVAERHFGRRLIEMRPTGCKVTRDVEQYAARLRRAIEDIHAASSALEQQFRDSERTLTIAVLATFAQRWLIPRLSGFQDRHPEIDIRLITTSRPADLVRDDVDLSIRCGSGNWPTSYATEFLVANRIFPVASKAYLESNPVNCLEDLNHAVFIRVDTPPRDQDWLTWLQLTAAMPINPRAWQTYSTSTQAIEAAIAGMGIAMAHTPFVVDSLSSGQLLKPFEENHLDSDGDYYLVYRKQQDTPLRIELFRDWLVTNSPATKRGTGAA